MILVDEELNVELMHGDQPIYWQLACAVLFFAKCGYVRRLSETPGQVLISPLIGNWLFQAEFNCACNVSGKVIEPPLHPAAAR
jgi:hypothetical protein